MENKWNDSSAKAAIKKYNDVHEDIALRVYTSHLIGADSALVLHGGGNTSVKSRTRNKVNEEVDVLAYYLENFKPCLVKRKNQRVIFSGFYLES